MYFLHGVFIGYMIFSYIRLKQLANKVLIENRQFRKFLLGHEFALPGKDSGIIYKIKNRLKNIKNRLMEIDEERRN